MLYNRVSETTLQTLIYVKTRANTYQRKLYICYELQEMLVK